jgi:hypothetical protein
MRALLALAAATAVLLAGTALRVLRDRRGSAGCEMTYMYTRFVEIQEVERAAPADARYRLFLYREAAGEGAQGESRMRVRMCVSAFVCVV